MELEKTGLGEPKLLREMMEINEDFNQAFFFTWSETIKIHQKKISGDY